MVDSGMDLTKGKESLANAEIAHYIMLSLYREYSILMLNNPDKKSEYVTKMRQIKNDMKYLSKDEIIEKAENFYKKILQNMKSK
jgi:hypothetical protein